MTGTWVGVALLAAAWLAMLGHYHQPDWWTGSLLLAAGLACLGGVLPRPALREPDAPVAPTPWQLLAGIVLLVPAVAVTPWPYKIAPVLLLAGLTGMAILCLEEDDPRPWGRAIAWLSSALAAGGVVLLVQILVLTGYEAFTARSHELPGALSQGLAYLANLAGIKVTVDGNNNIVMYAFRLPQRLGATWELLVDPATLGFLAGGLALLAIRAWQGLAGNRALWKAALGLVLCVLAWLPMRAVLLMAIYMHRVLRTEYDAPIDLMDQFWSTWVHLLLLAGPVFLAAVFARWPRQASGAPAAAPSRSLQVTASLVVALGVAAISAGILWNPPGPRKAGRILVDEYHSKWEDTRRPFDTQWYGHESTYQFSAAFDYLGRFYQTGRIETPITDKILEDCDVLIAKVPTSPYSPDELQAVTRFVQRDGGLLLIGEHTNVFATSDNLNMLARRFGFVFRDDCLFDVDRVFLQAHRSAVVPHPAVQYLPKQDGKGRLDWVVSCSIEPQWSSGQAAIRSIGLNNLPVDYYANNFYPQVHNHPYMRYGAFVQVWATEYGRGRVIGFGDSTQLSNFCVFEPGKIELQMGMIEWLNRYSTADARGLLAAGGALMLLLALGAGWRWTGGWVVLVAAGLLGWTATVIGVNAAHAAAMPLPAPIKPLVRVAMDQTVSGGKLPLGGFISGQPDGFGIFEMWILRLGYFTGRRSGPEAFDSADMLVFTYPNKPVTDEFREGLRRYVEQGGRVLVIDSADNRGSSASSLLLPFGMAVQHETAVSGILTVPEGWPTTAVSEARPISGGEPFMEIDGKPVAASVFLGKGSVTAIGFGSAFTDLRMGIMADVVPTPELRQVFELEYLLIRVIMADKAKAASLALGS